MVYGPVLADVMFLAGGVRILNILHVVPAGAMHIRYVVMIIVARGPHFY